MRWSSFHPVLLALPALAGSLCSCASQTQQVTTTTVATTSPGLRGPGVGLELHWWVIDDNPFDDKFQPGGAPRLLGSNTKPLAEVLAPYLNRVIPVTKESRERWKANGFRLVSVPKADIELVRDTLRIVGPIQQQWVGESPRWMESMRGPKWSSAQAVVMDDTPLALSAGSLRMLMRCWAGPALASAGVDLTKLPSGSIPGAVQIEFVPQHVLPPARADLAALLKARPSIENEGTIFSALTLEASIANDDVLLIVPDSPDAEWKITPQTEPTSEDALFSSQGPPLPTIPSLGEVMMTDLITGGRRNTRVILVVQPMPPPTFNLLGR